MKKSNEPCKCAVCKKETATCVKIETKDGLHCVDLEGEDGDMLKEFQQAQENAQVVLKTIVSMLKPLDIRRESELMATMMLVMKRMIEVAADGDKEREKAIANHICMALMNTEMRAGI